MQTRLKGRFRRGTMICWAEIEVWPASAFKKIADGRQSGSICTVVNLTVTSMMTFGIVE